MSPWFPPSGNETTQGKVLDRKVIKKGKTDSLLLYAFGTILALV